MSDQLSSHAKNTAFLNRITGEGYLGSCEFRENPNAFPLHFDYCYSGSCAPALRITSPTLILFPGRTPFGLSEILAAAIDRIKAN
jgi:hypothetical protein